MSKILVTGATGQYGKAAVEALVNNTENNGAIYAMVRDETKAAELASWGVNLVWGDYNDYYSLIKAFSGIDKLLFISSGEMQNRGWPAGGLSHAPGKGRPGAAVDCVWG